MAGYPITPVVLLGATPATSRSLMMRRQAGLGMACDDILGAIGPVELEQAHVTLVQAIAGANILR
jgi:hypothetical protein